MNQLILDNQNFIYYLFNITAGGLQALSLISGLSYQWWNIVIWFGLIPALWIFMVSRKTTPWINLISLALFIAMFSIGAWNKWFDEAVVMLNDLCALFGPDYRQMSVYLCLFFPALITVVLGLLCLSKRNQKILNLSFLVSSIIVIIGFPISNYVLKKYSHRLNIGNMYQEGLESLKK